MSVRMPVEKMSTTDRIQAMGRLGDALTHEDFELELPSWHEDVLQSRRELIESGEAEFITLENFKKQARKASQFWSL